MYGPLHIGNARALIFPDLFYRFLKYLDYDVQFVRNYTDVDDKIIDRANKDGKTALEVSDVVARTAKTILRALVFCLLENGKSH